MTSRTLLSLSFSLLFLTAITCGDDGGGETTTGGGDTSGGDTSGGDTSGGDTSGGDTSGGDTSGGDTSGGDTSGGDTSGGDTSGGDTGVVGIGQAHIVSSCDAAEGCETMVLWAGASEDAASITHYTWDFGGGDVVDGPTLDLVYRPLGTSTLNTVTLTVEYPGGSSSTTQYMANTEVGTTETHPLPRPPQLTVIIGPMGACGTPTPVVTVGGCIDGGNDGVRFNGSMTTPMKPLTPVLFDITTSRMHDAGFSRGAAWYQAAFAGGAVQFDGDVNAANYGTHQAYTPQVYDPVVAALSSGPTALHLQEHFTFWFNTPKVGQTSISPAHELYPGTSDVVVVNSDDQFVFTCEGEDIPPVVTLEALAFDDHDFESAW